MESQTIMRKDETGTRIDIEYEKGRKLGNVHVQNESNRKETLFRYPADPDDAEIERAIQSSDILNRAYNLKKSEKVAYLKSQIKKAIEMMTTFAETGYTSD
ncbi:hypothetical protein QUB47_18880 [Microcoleus sp. AT9_B5]